MIRKSLPDDEIDRGHYAPWFSRFAPGPRRTHKVAHGHPADVVDLAVGQVQGRHAVNSSAETCRCATPCTPRLPRGATGDQLAAVVSPSGPRSMT